MGDKYKSQEKYDAANTRKFGIKLNRKTDAAAIDKLESVESIQGYIKQLIRQDVEMTPFLRVLVLKNTEGYELMDLAGENGLKRARMFKGGEIIHVIEKENGKIDVKKGDA